MGSVSAENMKVHECHSDLLHNLFIMSALLRFQTMSQRRALQKQTQTCQRQAASNGLDDLLLTSSLHFKLIGQRYALQTQTQTCQRQAASNGLF